MDFDRAEFLDDIDPKEEIVELVTQQMTNIRKRMAEIKVQIEATQKQVENEQSRYSGIAIDLRTIKETIEMVPREDIRDKYDEALDVRFRLATMRGQLEKFEANYEELERHQTLLSDVLSKLQGFNVIIDEESAAGRNNGGLDVMGIIRAQEEERQRLARQMHDGPAQSLTNFILQAEICQRLFDRSPERAAEELNNLKSNASKTFQKIRDFIFDLRPMMLDDLGVAPTVRRYAESYKDKNDIQTNVKIINEDKSLETYRAVLIFRSIQELMVMARDYSAPTTVNIQLDMATNPIKIQVEDDGRSFDAEAVFNVDPNEPHNDARIMGLLTLKSKIELVGGSITVHSSDSEGTVVRIELPAE